MKKNLIYTIASTVALLVVTSCTTDEMTEQGTGNGAFRLSSDKGTFTRAATESTFSEGTAYQIYAVDATSNDFRYNYLTNPASPDATTGRESADHQSIDGIEINKFNGKTLSFYAVTNSTEEAVNIISNGKNAPTCNIQYKADGSALTDVMWAKKESQSYLNSGSIKLLFGHTLAKLNLYVMKHSDYNSTTVKLNSISLKDYPNGALNMQTGKYNLESSDARNHKCTVYTGTQDVTSTAKVVEKENIAVTPMIFPTRKENLEESDRTNHSMRVNVEVTIGDQKTTREIEITSTLAGDAGSTPTTKEIPFEFKSNHEYDMVITITKSSLIVTIVPRLYDWIPEEELKEDDEVNGSMTIGGITWMDRNLGATSGDPLAGDQAWENSRGYYYQYGRNIPYYINTKTDSYGITYALSNGNWHLKESMPYPHIPGHMNNAPVTSNSKMAKNPTDDTNFNFCYGNSAWNSYSNWSTNNDQPCPKGWRVPTSNEFKLIIPATAKAGDIPFLLSGHKNNNYYTENESDDPESGSNSVYIGVKKNTQNETTVGITNSIYALKRKGTDKAYFLRWHIERSGIYKIEDNKCTGDKGDPYRNVLVISRYPATKNSTLSQGNVKDAAKWSNPVEQIKLPISGYIHIGQEYASSGSNYPALIYSGSEAVYWTSEDAHTVRMKFAGDAASNQIMMYSSEIRNNGCLIRCVRDTKAN